MIKLTSICTVASKPQCKTPEAAASRRDLRAASDQGVQLGSELATTKASAVLASANGAGFKSSFVSSWNAAPAVAGDQNLRLTTADFKSAAVVIQPLAPASPDSPQASS